MRLVTLNFTDWLEAIFWHSFWHIFWHSFWHIFWHCFWHSFWHIFWHCFWHYFWHISWHSVWHSFWHIVWHSFGHISWHSVNSVWHSVWHSFWHSFWHLLTFCLANLLTYLLIFLLTYLLTCVLTFFLAYCLTSFLTFCLTYVLSFCLTFFLAYCLTFCQFCLTFFLTFWLTFFLTFCLTFFLTYLLTFFLTFYLAVEVRQGTLSADGRGWGPAGNTERRWSPLRSGRERFGVTSPAVTIIWPKSLIADLGSWNILDTQLPSGQCLSVWRLDCTIPRIPDIELQCCHQVHWKNLQFNRFPSKNKSHGFIPMDFGDAFWSCNSYQATVASSSFEFGCVSKFICQICSFFGFIWYTLRSLETQTTPARRNEGLIQGQWWQNKTCPAEFWWLVVSNVQSSQRYTYANHFLNKKTWLGHVEP